MRALGNYFVDALAGLRAAWRSALLATATVAAAVFVLGAFLLVSETVGAAIAGWSRAAELSVFVARDASAGARAEIERTLRGSPLVADVVWVSEAEATRRFLEDFPDLAGLVRSFERSPIPASFDARLRAERADDRALTALVDSVRAMPGTADVRVDRGLVDRLNALAAGGRLAGLVLAGVLAAAAALAVLSVIRLSYVARRDEVDILLLVGAPLATIRGPFVVEGWLQATAGSAVALVGLWAAHRAMVARTGGALAAALGLGELPFLGWPLVLAILVGSGVVGALAGLGAVGRRVLARDDARGAPGGEPPSSASSALTGVSPGD